MKLTILASGNGTNLQNIINKIEEGVLSQFSIIKVIGDKDCKALQRAEKHNIPFQYIPKNKDFSAKLLTAIPPETDIIVLAGFLTILTKEFCKIWEHKIINIHPSLLPKYGGKGMYGKHVHQAVVNNNEKVSGATVHFVTSSIDEGKIILQKSVQITENETADSLAKKIHSIEYSLLIEALKLIAKNA